VKRRELIQQIEALGCVLIGHGGKHDWYQNPRTRIAQPVPRHREIHEFLARSVLKKLS
jgi:predicted RNA binding protein YcfA (HicA-like mRNA interferase family)